MAWFRGLKTTYYLRALAATSTEKSTINTGKLNAVSAGGNDGCKPPRPPSRSRRRCRRHAASTTPTAKPASDRASLNGVRVVAGQAGLLP